MSAISCVNSCIPTTSWRRSTATHAARTTTSERWQRSRSTGYRGPQARRYAGPNQDVLPMTPYRFPPLPPFNRPGQGHIYTDRARQSLGDNRRMPAAKELARLAGVSAGTVSNVISGTARVSEAARQKVLEAIRALDCRPNLIARSLKTNRTNTLGIVIPEITVPFFPKLIRGAASAARERGCCLIVGGV